MIKDDVKDRTHGLQTADQHYSVTEPLDGEAFDVVLMLTLCRSGAH